MFFADLTPYEYGHREEVRSNLLNVGWLSKGHPFATGATPVGLVEALRRLAATPVKLYRGSHQCEFCPYPPVGLNRPGGLLMIFPPPGTDGNGEIRVPGENGVIYVAPVLVVHYVQAHEYLPPPPFIDAVIRCASDESARPQEAVASPQAAPQHAPYPYPGRFAVGDQVRVSPRSQLEWFSAEWKWHHPLQTEQLSFADSAANVREVIRYQNGDVLYSLEGVPGIWHEICLAPASKPRDEVETGRVPAA